MLRHRGRALGWVTGLQFESEPLVVFPSQVAPRRKRPPEIKHPPPTQTGISEYYLQVRNLASVFSALVKDSINALQSVKSNAYLLSGDIEPADWSCSTPIDLPKLSLCALSSTPVKSITPSLGIMSAHMLGRVTGPIGSTGARKISRNRSSQRRGHNALSRNLGIFTLAAGAMKRSPCFDFFPVRTNPTFLRVLALQVQLSRCDRARNRRSNHYTICGGKPHGVKGL